MIFLCYPRGRWSSRHGAAEQAECEGVSMRQQRGAAACKARIPRTVFAVCPAALTPLAGQAPSGQCGAASKKLTQRHHLPAPAFGRGAEPSKAQGDRLDAKDRERRGIQGTLTGASQVTVTRELEGGGSMLGASPRVRTCSPRCDPASATPTAHTTIKRAMREARGS